MRCKKIYIGDELLQGEWEYGLGSIYLGGPRNPEEESWRVQFMKKIEDLETPVSFLIPETKNQLKKGGRCKLSQNDIFDWQNVAASVASSVVFWYPSVSKDTQPFTEFGSWSKVERCFLGRKGSQPYLDWLYYKQQKLYPADSIEQLAEMVIHWIIE